jgi:periplasmic protein TonB
MRSLINKPEKLSGLILVALVHAALLYATWSYQSVAVPKEESTLFVNLISPPVKKDEPPEPPKPEPPKKVALDKPKPLAPPRPVPMLVAETPVTSVADYVAPPPVTVPVVEAPVAHAPVVVAQAQPAPPMILTSELSLACFKRTPPDYPSASRRMAEQGRVVLRVELDETGIITKVAVKEGSGYKRLDEPALAAVKGWQCNAAMRGGVAVRAVALQPFDFNLN